jgi:cytochrome c553
MCVAASLGSWGIPVLGADEAVLKSRVPIDQLDEARTWANPLPATEETIEKGKRLFHGKAFCMTCHGKDGKGLGADIEPGILKGPLPRNFTDKDWQAARTDGEPSGFKERQQDGDGVLHSARADGRRSLAGAAICAVFRSTVRGLHLLLRLPHECPALDQLTNFRAPLLKYREGLIQPTICVESWKRLTHECRR